MTKQLKQLTLIGMLLIAVLFGSNAYANEFNFSVNAVIPENQVDKTKTYFDLKLAQGEKQTLTVELRNDTAKEVIVETIINSATTNLNGVVEYGKNDIKPDESLKHNLKDLAKTADEVTIPAKSEKVVKIDVTMPNEAFDGVIAGGITFKEKSSEKESTKSDSNGLAINNEYSYVIAMLLRQNEKALAPNLALTGVSANQVNARNVINVGLQNPISTYLNQLVVKADIYKKGSNEPVYSKEQAGMQMAPNSNFEFPVSLEGKKMEAGDYVVKVSAYGVKSDSGTHTVKLANGETAKYEHFWEFEDEFSIAADEARAFNRTDVSVEDNSLWLYLIIGIVLLFLVIILLIILYFRKKNKDKEE